MTTRLQHIDYNTLSDLVDYPARTEAILGSLSANKKLTQVTAAYLAFQHARLPLTPWFDSDFSAIPNELVRCGLFRVADPSDPRVMLKDATFNVQAAKGGYLKYTGEELRQDDRQVFMELLAVERSSPGIAVISPRKFCNQILSWGNSNPAVEKLLASIKRLKANALELTSPRLKMKVTISLVRKFESRADGKIVIFFEEEVRELFRDNHYTLILREYQSRLPKRANLAAWLLGFYASHREPQDMKIADLHKLCGAKSQAKAFKQMLAEALLALQNTCFLEDFSVGEKVVSVKRA